MRTAIRVTAAAAVAAVTTAAAAVATAAPAFASVSSPAGADGGHAVFVQTDNTAGNHVVAYRRAADGTLSPAGSFATGGRGGILDGSVVDHTASQGSLGLDTRHGLLYAVNAGSNTISVFAVHGDRLALRQVLGSGGTFPVSVTVHGDLVYVLNALNGGSVQGYRVLGTVLAPLPGSPIPSRPWTRPGSAATAAGPTRRSTGSRRPSDGWRRASLLAVSGSGSTCCPPASARWCCSATLRG